VTVAQLIAHLAKLPPDAQVTMLYDSCCASYALEPGLIVNHETDGVLFLCEGEDEVEDLMANYDFFGGKS
jgi:hypothetical protein